MMKTKTIALSALVALLLLGAAGVAIAHQGFLPGSHPAGPTVKGLGSQGEDNGNQTTSHQNDNETEDQGNNNQTSTNEDNNNQTSIQHEDNETEVEDEGGLNLTVGQTLTFSGLTGHFNNVTNESSDDGEDNSAVGIR